jgi:hypothetical protein
MLAKAKWQNVSRRNGTKFAAAVTPGALATIGALAATDEARARRLTFVSLARISEFLRGPMLGVFVVRSAGSLLPIGGGAGDMCTTVSAAEICIDP